MTLSERDKKHLWHPLTQHKLHPDHLVIKKAKDATLWDDSDNAYIDGIASWYTCMYGHCNDYIIKKVTEQFQNLDQVVFSGFTHEPAIKMSENLMDILPENQQKIFFSDNGSTSVDIAIKMALQFHFNQNKTKKTIVCLDNAFHGDTFGAMAVSGLSVYNGPFSDFTFSVKRIPVPNKENIDDIIKNLNSWIDEGDLAGFIFEPLVQGAAAMKMYEPEYLDQLIKICKDNNVVTIADEVMTGFGKTGSHFASDYLTHKPDILCLSKSLTGGLVPMALTTCSQEIYDAFYDNDMAKGLFHGHTYSANPTACTAVSASIDLLKSEEIQSDINRIHSKHLEFEKHIKTHSKVESTRVLGVIFALDMNIDLDRYGKKRYEIFNYFMKKGVFLRPLGNTIYILPPFVITDNELETIYSAILDGLNTNFSIS
ncbi:MAG: adenosylmethionine--8-amino-7-oxononanoate transaminase [Flavobacteriales bacterium]